MVLLVTGNSTERRAAKTTLGFVLCFMIPLWRSFSLRVLNLIIWIQLVNWCQSFCLFFRFTQTVMTSTSCGQDLTSSLTYYAAFKTSRRSTTFPGITECSNVWVHCHHFLCYKYHQRAVLSPSDQPMCLLASPAKRLVWTGASLKDEMNHAVRQRAIYCCYVCIYFRSVSVKALEWF